MKIDPFGNIPVPVRDLDAEERWQEWCDTWDAEHAQPDRQLDPSRLSDEELLKAAVGPEPVKYDPNDPSFWLPEPKEA